MITYRHFKVKGEINIGLQFSTFPFGSVVDYGRTTIIIVYVVVILLRFKKLFN